MNIALALQKIPADKLHRLVARAQDRYPEGIVTLHKEHWMLWYNTPDGSTHTASVPVK